MDNFSILKQPTPTDANLAQAINAKIKAKQDAETSKMQLQSSIAEANKQIAKACDKLVAFVTKGNLTDSPGTTSTIKYIKKMGKDFIILT